jgi:hypothetical protein
MKDVTGQGYMRSSQQVCSMAVRLCAKLEVASSMRPVDNAPCVGYFPVGDTLVKPEQEPQSWSVDHSRAMQPMAID